MKELSVGFDITPIFWYSPTRFSKKLVLPSSEIFSMKSNGFSALNIWKTRILITNGFSDLGVAWKSSTNLGARTRNKTGNLRACLMQIQFAILWVKPLPPLCLWCCTSVCLFICCSPTEEKAEALAMHSFHHTAYLPVTTYQGWWCRSPSRPWWH